MYVSTIRFALILCYRLVIVSVYGWGRCTYPLPEEASTGLLFIIGNVAGIPVVFALSALIQLREGCVHVFTVRKAFNESEPPSPPPPLYFFFLAIFHHTQI